MATNDIPFKRENSGGSYDNLKLPADRTVFKDALDIRAQDIKDSTATGRSLVTAANAAAARAALELQAALFDPTKAQGNITALNQALVSPGGANTGAWYVSVVAGTLSGTNSGGLSVVAGDYLVSNGSVYVKVSSNVAALVAANALAEIRQLGVVPVLDASRNINAARRDDVVPSQLRNAYDKLWKVNSRRSLAGSRAITGTASTDTINLTAHGFLNGEIVSFPTLTGGAGLTASTARYFVRDAAANTFRVAATAGGAAIDITTDITSGTVLWLSVPRMTIGVIGDSVANSKPQFLIPLFTRLYGGSALTAGIAWGVTGDAWAADGTGPRPFDSLVSPTGGYWSIGSGTGVVSWTAGGGGVSATRIALYYIIEPGAGVFKIQCNTTWNVAGGSWVDEAAHTSVNASGGSVTYGKIVLEPTPGFNTIRVQHVSGGRVRFLTPLYTDTSTPGVTVRGMDVGGSNIGGYGQWMPTLANDYLTESGIDLAFFEAKENSSYMAAALTSLTNLFSSALPMMDWIFIESCPVDTNDAEEVDMQLQNKILREHAASIGKYCFDGHTPTGGRAAMVANGWRGDGIHVSAILSEYLAWMIFEKIQFLFPRMPVGFTGVDGHLANSFSLLGSSIRPWITINDTPSDGISIRPQIAAGEAGKNFVAIRHPASNVPMWVFSHHPNQAGSPSSIPNWFFFTETMSPAASFGVRAEGLELRLVSTFGGSPSAFFRSLNCLRSVETSSVASGQGNIAANSPTTFTLPASPVVGQRQFFTSRNATWTIAQPASTIIRAGANATTAGTSGTLAGALYDSVELEFVGSTSGINEWRVVAASPGATLTWT